MAKRPDLKALWGKVRARSLMPRHPGGLAALRIGCGAVILGEVLQMLEHKSLIFLLPGTPWRPEWDPGIGLVVWALAAVALTAGAWTRLAAVVHLVCAWTFMGALRSFEYHHDFVMMSVGTFLLLAPVGQAWGVDAWRRKRGDKTAPVYEPVLQCHHDVFLFFGVGLFYFDSVFFKLGSPMWRHGLGMWMPATLPNLAANDLSILLDQHWLVIGLGYLTLVFEAVFIFVMWWRKAHLPLFVVGLGLHIGIVLAFPIPWFGLGMACLYLLLLPDLVWQRLESREIPTVPVPTNWRVRVLAVLMVVGLSTQLYIIGKRTDFARMAQPMEMGEVLLNFRTDRPGGLEAAWLKTMKFTLGVTDHPLFMDMHFQGYNDLYTVRLSGPNGQEYWLGPLTKAGFPSEQSQGRMWAYFTFRFNHPGPSLNKVSRELPRFTGDWLKKNGLPHDNVRFDLMHRRLELPTQWEEGFLKGQANKPWRQVGQAIWERGQMRLELEVAPK